MRIRLSDDEGKQIAELTETARLTTGRVLSSSAWLRGAVSAAMDDANMAKRIAEAAPEAGHGGQREGAGRPKRT